MLTLPLIPKLYSAALHGAAAGWIATSAYLLVGAGEPVAGIIGLPLALAVFAFPHFERR